jgi:hypothetical protein
MKSTTAFAVVLAVGGLALAGCGTLPRPSAAGGREAIEADPWHDGWEDIFDHGPDFRLGVPSEAWGRRSALPSFWQWAPENPEARAAIDPRLAGWAEAFDHGPSFHVGRLH